MNVSIVGCNYTFAGKAFMSEMTGNQSINEVPHASIWYPVPSRQRYGVKLS